MTTSLLERPARTMWQAARDLLDDAMARRCPETWGRGYRLWLQAAASRARGEPFDLMAYHARWLPTTPADGCGRP